MCRFTLFLARPPGICHSFVTECLPQSRNFYEKNMETIDQDKRVLKYGALINGFDLIPEKREEKSLP